MIGASAKGEPTMSEIAYASGTSTVPLLGQTIGQNLAATVARHGDREALVRTTTS
jgi:fatty-acyl-CoA synthase